MPVKNWLRIRSSVLAIAVSAASIGVVHADSSELRIAMQERDYARAAEISRKLAKEENAYAQFVLGSLLLRGEGGPKDVGRGLELLDLSGRQGYSEALASLGVLHYRKEIPNANISRAYMYLTLADQFGLSRAGTMAFFLIAEMTEEDYGLAQIYIREWRGETGHYPTNN